MTVPVQPGVDPLIENVAAPVAGAIEVTPAGTLIDPQDPPVTPASPPELDAAAMKSEMQAARREAANYRTKLKKLEKAEEERARTAMSEAEKTTADLTAAQDKISGLEKQLSAQALTAKVQAIAADKVQPGAMDIIVQLLDLDSLGEDEIGPAIDAILETKPFLAKDNQRGGPITPTNPARGQNLETDAQKRARLLQGQRPVSVFGSGKPS